jgi:hypothetical protein
MLASELSEPGISLRQLGRAGHRKFWLKVSPGNYPMGPTLRLSQNWSVQYIGDSVFIQGTAGLLEAVKKAKANIDKLNKNRLSIEMLMADLRFKFPAAPQNIPTIAQWKTASDQNVRFRAVASRKEQIAALDKLIKDYPNARTVEEKYVLLFTMQREIHSHIKKKADSDRRDAVERLGQP